MDEGTSALDVNTERRINAELKRLSITRIIAAHRPETLAAADRVIGLQRGKLREVEFNLRTADASCRTLTDTSEALLKENAETINGLAAVSSAVSKETVDPILMGVLKLKAKLFNVFHR